MPRMDLKNDGSDRNRTRHFLQPRGECHCFAAAVVTAPLWGLTHSSLLTPKLAAHTIIDATESISNQGGRTSCRKEVSYESIENWARTFGATDGGRRGPTGIEFTGDSFWALPSNCGTFHPLATQQQAARDFITAAIRGNLAIGKGSGPASPLSVLYEKAGLYR